MDDVTLVLALVFCAGSFFFYRRVWQAINSIREMNVMLFALLRIAGTSDPEAARIVARTKSVLDEM